MQIPAYKVKRYKRSLKLFLGFRAEDNYATLFDTHALDALGRILTEEATMQLFLQRYRISERTQRRKEVRHTIHHWLADFATHGTFS